MEFLVLLTLGHTVKKTIADHQEIRQPERNAKDHNCKFDGKLTFFRQPQCANGGFFNRASIVRFRPKLG
jgi:hypothetical protein